MSTFSRLSQLVGGGRNRQAVLDEIAAGIPGVTTLDPAATVALPALTGVGTADNDLLAVVDVSAAATKKQTFTEHLAKLVSMTWAFAVNITVKGITVGRGSADAVAGNTAVGAGAGAALTEGPANTLVGDGSGKLLTTGGYNTVLGNDDAGGSLVDGFSNTLVGAGAGTSLVSNSELVGVGPYTLGGWDGTGSGDGATAVGFRALGATGPAAVNNTGVGHLAGSGITTGDNNTTLGKGAGAGITTGNNNTVIGSGAAASAAAAADEITLGNATQSKLRLPGMSAAAGADAVSTHRLKIRVLIAGMETDLYVLATTVAP